MKHTALSLSAVAAALLALGGCGGDKRLAYQKVHIAELERALAELEGNLAAKDAELQACLARGGAAPARDVPPPQQGLHIPNTEIGTRDKEIVIAISNEVLFKPGSAVLSDTSKKTLGEVIRTVKEKFPNHYVRVEGHTDSNPIKRSKDKWEDNWDLSGGRAMAVLRYLRDNGIAEADLGFSGYGMVRPRSDNKNAAGMARNRRVEIVVIPKGK